MAFKIKLAGIGFQVNGIYEESLKKHCGDYLDIEENSDNKKCFDNCVAGKEDLIMIRYMKLLYQRMT